MAGSVGILFCGVDLTDDDTLEALDMIPGIDWTAHRGLVRIGALVDDGDLLQRTSHLITSVVAAVPTARPVRVDRDIVSISDIADRVGVNREAVRHWANGTRGNGLFPSPVGVVSNETRIFEWWEVDQWLESNLALGDEVGHLCLEDLARVDLLVSQWNRRLSGCEGWTVTTHNKVALPVHREVAAPVRSAEYTPSTSWREHTLVRTEVGVA